MFPKLPDKKYSIIYADPPWSYEINPGDYSPSMGADIKYNTVSIQDLKALGVPDISEDNCLLFMWITNTHIKEGIELGEAWGFKHRTLAFCWKKGNRKNRSRYNIMQQTEFCFLFKKGKVPAHQKGNKAQNSFIDEPPVRHSQKPAEALFRIQRLYPDLKRIELFARPSSYGQQNIFGEKPDDNWDFWGNEVSLPE